nr:MAG TPA: hypothetical protein [Caudoviricetes sp.]
MVELIQIYYLITYLTNYCSVHLLVIQIQTSITNMLNGVKECLWEIPNTLWLHLTAKL